MPDSPCLEELNILNQMLAELQLLNGTKAPKTGMYGNWNYVKIGKEVTYYQKVTLTGSAQNIDLDISIPVQLNRISTFANDTTSKSYTIQAFAGQYDNYETIGSATASITQSVVDQFGIEYVYPSITKIRIAVSASTNGKTLVVSITVREL